MADQDLTQLTATTTPADGDLLYTVVDPAGTPLDRKITWTSVKAFLKTYLDSLYTTIAVAAGKKVLHGVVARPVGAQNPLPTYITTSTFTLGATANPITYYYNGTEVIVSADKTTTLGAAGFYFIYFNAATGNLLNGTTFPGFTTTSNVIIATVNWNGSNYGLVNDERHGHTRDLAWHNWAHTTVGVRYGSGITLTHNGGTGAAATFSTTAGNVYDEDIDFTISASSAWPTPNALRTFFQDTATTHQFNTTPSTTPFRLGTGGRPEVIDSATFVKTTLPSANNRFINAFIYVTDDLHTPLYSFVEVASTATITAGGYTSLALARAVPFPSLAGKGVGQELKAIYRLIIRADGVLQAIDTAQDDYRTVSSLPQAAGIGGTTASSVSFNPAGNISSTTVQTAMEELDAEKALLAGNTAQSFGASTIELGHASDTTISRVSAGVLAVEGVTIDTISATNTLTNKRITKRISTVTQAAAPTINTDNGDIFAITGLAQAITSMTTNLSGTPSAGDIIMFQITDNGTARAITWGASFAATTAVPLPTTTVISTMLRVLFQRNAANNAWDCIGSV